LERPGALVSQPIFHLVDGANELQDPGGNARVIVRCLFEFASDVRKAGHGGDAQLRVTVDEGAVGAKSIALEVSVEELLALFVNKDTVEADVGAAFVPVEKDAVFCVMIDPEVAGGDFAIAGFEAADGGLVDLEVIGLAKLYTKDFV
jgi:hypothetical protein